MGLTILNTDDPIRKQDGSLPIQEDRLRIASVGRVEYEGSGGTVWVCFGLKDGWGDFNNGDRLLGGRTNFGAVPITLPRTPRRARITPDIGGQTPVTVSLQSADPGKSYGVYTWVADQPTADESRFVSPKPWLTSFEPIEIAIITKPEPILAAIGQPSLALSGT